MWIAPVRLALVALLGVVLPSSAWAKTWTVASSGGDTTKIQSAINSASSGDTISVKPGTYTENLDTKGKNLTIRSTGGSGSTTVDGRNGDECLEVDDGEVVVFEGFMLTRCSHGAFVQGSTLTADDVVVSGVTGESPGGGFTASDGSTLTVSDCEVDGVVIQNNAYGGALFIEDSAASFQSCTFSNNTAYRGGGAYITGSTVSFTDVGFSGNTSEGPGGGLRVLGGSQITGTRLSLTDNVAAGKGGGLHLEASGLSCQNCTLTGNVAGSSGGGAAIDGAAGYTASFTGSSTRICDNTSAGTGAGIYSYGLNLKLVGTLCDNTSTASDPSGVGLYFGGGDLTLQDLDLSGHSGGSGAGVYVAGASGETVSASGGTWQDNLSTGDGGALYSEAPLTLDGVVLSGNQAAGKGGGIAVSGATATVTDASFSGNEAERGGGLWVYKAALTAKRTAFTANLATVGAGLYHQAVDTKGANLTLSKCSFTRNTASSQGGGAAVDSARVVLSSRDTFTQNSPEGAWVSGANSLTVKYSVFSGNAEEGLLAQTIAGGQVLGARFAGSGGDGLSLSAAGVLDIANAVFIGNAGAGLLVSSPDAGVEVRNCDAVDNGVGVDLRYGEPVTVVNTIAAANAGDGFSTTSHTPDLSYSDAWGNGDDWGKGLAVLTGTRGNLSQDPQYTGFSDDGDPDNDLLYLGSSSPCRDAGDPAILDAGGDRSDMGSFGGPDANDEDQDGDGFRPSTGDCDESDAAIYPGAPEVWYDGLDGDCAGGDDFDQDGDGWRHELAGQAQVDCDDQDADIHPGAAETPDDGVDQDCDGEDLSTGPGDSGADDSGADDSGADDSGGHDSADDSEVLSTVDQDGDGVSSAEGDCDDYDRAAYPGAPESCLDGVDTDCDGLPDSLDEDCADGGGCAGCASGGAPGVGLWVVLGLLWGRRRG